MARCAGVRRGSFVTGAEAREVSALGRAHAGLGRRLKLSYTVTI
jgi:hypothetical protein